MAGVVTENDGCNRAVWGLKMVVVVRENGGRNGVVGGSKMTVVVREGGGRKGVVVEDGEGEWCSQRSSVMVENGDSGEGE